jgi:hypothetical protein
MLRWRRLSFFCNFFSSLLLNAKALVECNPRTLVIGCCTYVNMFPPYEVLCYLSEVVFPILLFL